MAGAWLPALGFILVSPSTGVVPHIKTAISNACQVIIKSETELSKLDTQSGDGDCSRPTMLKGGADGRNSLNMSRQTVVQRLPYKLK